MKQIVIYFLMMSLFFSLSTDILAQKYGTALGFRATRTSGIGFTLQQRIQSKTTIEGIFTFSSKRLTGTVLYEYHRPLVFFKGFNYYGGLGAHFGNFKDQGNFGGFDVIAGIEIKLPIFPMLFSFDLKPTFHLEHPVLNNFEFQGGISARYIIVTHRQLKKRKRRKARQKRKEERAERRSERKGIFPIFRKNDKKEQKNKKDKDKGERKKFKDLFKKKE